MKITLGEVISQDQVNTRKYEGIIDTHKSEIPHSNILEIILEGIELEFNSGISQNLCLVMSRLYMKDLQKVQVTKNNEIIVSNLIPNCYQMILSNPDIESKEYDEASSHFSMNAKSVRTEDFLSFRDVNESIAISEDNKKSNMSQLKLSLLIQNQTTNVDFLFANLRLIITLPIFERLAKFQEKILELQKVNDDDKIKTKLSEVNKILNEANDESDSDEVKEDKEDKDYELKLEKISSHLMKKSNNKSGEPSKSYLQKIVEQRNLYLMKGKKPKIKIIDQKSKINAKGKLKNFEVWIPLDSKDEYSRVISLSFSNQISYKGTTQIKHKINEITNQLIESAVIKDQKDANVMMNQLMIVMVNRHLIRIQDNLTSEKLLLPSRISLCFDKFVNNPKEIDITNIEVMIEPFDMKIGFRELDNFKQLQELMNDFVQRISQSNTSSDDNKLIAIEHAGQQDLEQMQKLEKQLIKDINKESKPKRIKSMKERKLKQLIRTNIKIISESINFSLMDDTGIHEYPLINFNISKIAANISQETGEDDAASFILKKMGISAYPFMKVEALLVLESNYFNMDSGSYEPLIEPYKCEATVLQKTAASSMQVGLKSDDMLNINLTYGMALAVKQILKKMNQKRDQWEDEQKVEETKMKSRRLTEMQTNTKKVGFMETKKRTLREGEEDEDISGFYFENFLGLNLRITLENHDSWIGEGITLNEEQEDASVIIFQEWEEPGERNFRNLRELNTLNKYIKKEQNGGKLVDNYEENIIRIDVYIEGFEPITGVPIEISGLRSYELTFKDETEKQAKNSKHQFSLVVNVKPEGVRKSVSFESQLLFTNQTEFDFEIAQVFTQSIEGDLSEISKNDIEKCLKTVQQQKSVETEDKKGLIYKDLVLFNNVNINEEFKVPLRWFLDDVAIYSRCKRGTKVSYQRFLPSLRNLFIKKDKTQNSYETLPKYYLLSQENIENTFIALDIIVNKCRPTALDRPPQFCCCIKPPICLNNMTFSEISVFRNSDDKLMHIIPPGGYSYIYEGVEHSRKDDESDSEEEKKAEPLRIKSDKQLKEDIKTELKLNKYIFRFEDDDGILLDSYPDYFYSSTHDYKFLKAEDDEEDEEDNENQENRAIFLKFEVIKFNTFVYTPYILINKTDIPLVFGEKKKKNNTTIFVPPNRNEFFNPRSDKKKKFSITTENYDWADSFDITTLGMSGEAALERQDNFDFKDKIIEKYSSNKLNLGVLISNLGGQYGKTTSIKIVPRYIFVNNCSKSIILAQDIKNCNKQFWISPGESTIYHFENKGSKDNYVKIREPDEKELKDSLFKCEEINTTNWSSRFSIDDFEDFQVSVQSKIESEEEAKENVISPEDEEEYAEVIPEANQDKKWYEPSKLTQFRRFIRVIITTQDEATLFIVLCDPNMPEYRINNLTGKKVLVYQKDAKERTIVRSLNKAKFVKSKGKVVDIVSFPIPFVWDDQSMNDK